MVERLTADLQITQKEKEALAVDLAVVRERFGAQEGALAGFLRAIAGHDVPPDQRTATLFDIASRWREAGLRLDALSASPNLSPDIARLRGDAEAARERGDVDATLAALAQIDRVEAEADDRLEAQERRARERVEEIAQERRLRRESRVASKRAAIETALAALRHAEAARAIFEEITLTVPPERRFAALRAVHEAYHVRGRDMGLNVDLERAVELARIACREAGTQTNAARRSTIWPYRLAFSASVSAATRLEQAVDAIRDALKEYGRERVPLAWAMMQTNLGNALRALGERERDGAAGAGRRGLSRRAGGAHARARPARLGDDADQSRQCAFAPWRTRKLKRASGAGRRGLSRRAGGGQARARPLDWAMTQNNLGAALQTIGARESSNERLEQAVAAYSAALEERTRERVPLEWAMTQNNLGAALRALGERESSNERLEQAVAAFRAALEEFTPEAAHYHHAGATQNLAGAQALLDSWRDASGSR
ncbi:MAG: tetratricopeptide repeat protein [Rhodoblastus sp.]|nr:MAG: tetratricopeptide repeat protein [Rhodoblastus sp.]